MEKYYDNGLALWGLKCGERRITGPMYLEVFDIKGQWAAVRFENEGTGIVNDKGETVKRLPDFQQLVFEENDFLKITNVRDFFIDLRSMKFMRLCLRTVSSGSLNCCLSAIGYTRGRSSIMEWRKSWVAHRVCARTVSI